MKNKTVKIIVLSFLYALFVAGVYACAHTQSMAKWHPVEVTPPVMCSDCHQDDRAALNHTTDYIKRHKFYADQQVQVCHVCHVESFCADCHAHREELKPSDKYKDSPERAMPHRGDYLSQHQIDGRINPASCFPCHGRENNERCRVCHK